MTESGCVTKKVTVRRAAWFRYHSCKSSPLNVLCRAERDQSPRFFGKRPSLTCDEFGTNRMHGGKDAS